MYNLSDRFILFYLFSPPTLYFEILKPTKIRGENGIIKSVYPSPKFTVNISCHIASSLFPYVLIYLVIYFFAEENKFTFNLTTQTYLLLVFLFVHVFLISFTLYQFLSCFIVVIIQRIFLMF